MKPSEAGAYRSRSSPSRASGVYGALAALGFALVVRAPVAAQSVEGDAGTGDAMAPGPTAAAAHTGVVVFGGDLVPHEDVLNSVRAHGPRSMTVLIEPVLRGADVALFNFETAALPEQPETNGQLRFNVHEPFVAALREAGFDGASVANNHAFDMGVRGVGSTVALFRRFGLLSIGGALARESPQAPSEFSLFGRTLCVFAATRLLNYEMRLPSSEEPRIAVARPRHRDEEQALVDAVRASRPRCAAIVVSLHTGTEYVSLPDAEDRAFVQRLAEAGADAIIAHHPHVPQPVRELTAAGRRVPVFFSLGNLLSNQGASADAVLREAPAANPSVPLDPRTRVGLLGVLRFAPDATEPRLNLVRYGYLPVWTVNTHRAALRAHEPPTITTALMPREGGGDAGLASVWQRVVAHVGPSLLLSVDDVPGARAAHALGDRVVAASRRNERDLLSQVPAVLPTP